MVCVSACLLDTTVSPTETAEPIASPHWVWTRVHGPKEPCIRWDPDDLPRGRGILGRGAPLRCCGLSSKLILTACCIERRRWSWRSQVSRSWRARSPTTVRHSPFTLSLSRCELSFPKVSTSTSQPTAPSVSRFTVQLLIVVRIEQSAGHMCVYPYRMR